MQSISMSSLKSRYGSSLFGEHFEIYERENLFIRFDGKETDHALVGRFLFLFYPIGAGLFLEFYVASYEIFFWRTL